jgi:hypothetical protein
MILGLTPSSKWNSRTLHRSTRVGPQRPFAAYTLRSSSVNLECLKRGPLGPQVFSPNFRRLFTWHHRVQYHRLPLPYRPPITPVSPVTILPNMLVVCPIHQENLPYSQNSNISFFGYEQSPPSRYIILHLILPSLGLPRTEGFQPQVLREHPGIIPRDAT